MITKGQIRLWTCDRCGFSFDAEHTDEPNGGYSCPCCELDDYKKKVTRQARRDRIALAALFFVAGFALGASAVMLLLARCG